MIGTWAVDWCCCCGLSHSWQYCILFTALFSGGSLGDADVLMFWLDIFDMLIGAVSIAYLYDDLLSTLALLPSCCWHENWYPDMERRLPLGRALSPSSSLSLDTISSYKVSVLPLFSLLAQKPTAKVWGGLQPVWLLLNCVILLLTLLLLTKLPSTIFSLPITAAVIFSKDSIAAEFSAGIPLVSVSPVLGVTTMTEDADMTAERMPSMWGLASARLITSHINDEQYIPWQVK